MTNPANSEVKNVLPVQAYFNIDGSFNTFIGQGLPFVISATESIGVIDTLVNGTFYPTFSPVSTGQITNIDITSTKLTWNPSTGVFSAPTFSGYLNGDALHTSNVTGGNASQLLYQISTGQTGFIPNGSTGQFLTSNGSSAPSWSTVATSVTIVDDTTNSGTFYPLFYSATSGSTNTVETSSTKLQYVPATGTLSATIFSGSGASLTNIPNSALTNPSFTLGSTNISLGNTVTTVAGLASVTSTAFVGALTGNSDTATLATNATNTAITDNTSSSATWYPTLVSNSTGNLPITTSSSKLSFVPSTGTLSATTFSGAATNLSGGAANRIPYQTAANTTAFITAPTAGSTVLNWGGSSFSWVSIGGSTMVYPAAGIPNSSGTGWNASYTTSGSGTVVALATSPVFVTPTLGVATATSLTENGFAVVSQKDVGYQPNQIPLNQMLGKLAFQDVLDTVTNNPYIDTQTTAINPSISLDFVNAKTLDSRITFTRASTATYYDGKTSALAEQNLALQSQTFATSWTASNITLGALTTAPDGTTTAYPITAGAINSTLLQTYTALAVPYTFSIYIQRISGVGNIDITVDGTTYVTQSTSGTWTKFSTTLTPSAGSKTIGIRLAILGDVVNIWGAQLEQRSVATPYVLTTSTAITNYIPQLLTASTNQPRIAGNPTTGQVFGLLLEGQRTNNLYYSQDFTQANWTKTNLTVYNTYMNVAPDGTVSAQSLVEDSSNTLKQLTQTFSIAGQTPADSSIFLKNISSTWVAITSSTATTNYYCICNLATGQIGYYGSVSSGTPSTGGGDSVVTAQMVNVGNGWYRCQMVSAVGATFTSYTIIPLRTVGNTIPTYNFANWNYTGNSSSTCYVWGAQFEYTGAINAEQVTSYILSGASQGTRYTDNAVITGTNFSSWYNSNQGSLFLDYYQGSTPYVTRFGYISNTANTSWYQTPINFGGTTNYTAWVVSDLGINTNTATNSINNALGAENKVAMSYSSGNSAWASNGGNVLTSSNTRVSGITGNTLIFSTGLNGYFYIKKFAYYPQALSASELQEITQ